MGASVANGQVRREGEGLLYVCLVHNEGHCVELALAEARELRNDLSEFLETAEA
jgi:hypothetical protein